MKPINHNILKFVIAAVKIILAAFAIIAVCYFLYGCSPAKQDQKALNRVEAHVNLLNAAWHKGSELWPCANDTVITTKSDTVTTTHTEIEYRHDTAHFTARDTLVQTITKTVRIHDTAAVVVVDKRLEKTLTDSLNFYKLQNAALKAENAEIRSQYSESKKGFTKTLWLVILFAVGVITGGAFLFAKSKSKLI